MSVTPVTFIEQPSERPTCTKCQGSNCKITFWSIMNKFKELRYPWTNLAEYLLKEYPSINSEKISFGEDRSYGRTDGRAQATTMAIGRV